MNQIETNAESRDPLCPNGGVIPQIDMKGS